MEFSTITLFKNITPSFFTFRNFYKDVWNVNEFIYIIGYNTIDDYNFIVTKYISSVSDVYQTKNIDQFNYNYFNSVQIFESIYNGIHNVFILYKTNNSKDPFNDFNKIKQICFTIIKTKYVSVNRKYISVDDDEFLFSNNIDIIKKTNEYRFHFVEIICNYKNDANLEWCFQSWFTHRLNDSVIKYNCGSCKTFFFLPLETTVNTNYGFWCHSNDYKYNNSCCKMFIESDKKSEIFDEIKKLGICFHYTSPNLRTLKKIKQKNRFYNDNNKIGNYRNIDENYNKVKNHYESIIDNELKKYIDERDTKICNEL